MKTGMESWDPSVIYVVGHQRPDTDAIAAALGYAWFLEQTGWEGVRAARTGQVAAQTAFALQHFGLEPPPLLSGVSATFAHAARRLSETTLETPLSALLACLGGGQRVVPVLDGGKQVAGLVTAAALARAFTTYGADALAQTCGAVMEAAPVFPATERLLDHRTGILRGEADDFVVTDAAGGYLGVATRTAVLEPPRARLVLVDHNELSQAVSGAEEAEIIGVLDHHRLGNPPTAAPIPFVVDPVGSTSTLVAERCRERAPGLPPALAGMLLSGLLSDTLVFRSPTTTERDRHAATWLGAVAGTDVAAYGELLLHSAPGLAARSVDEILDGDRKQYEIGTAKLSIAQVEVTGLHELPARRTDLLAGLDARREREGLALACLMVTDVVAIRSHLLARGEPSLLRALNFPRYAAGEWDLEEIISRKKQLVPALYALLENR